MNSPLFRPSLAAFLACALVLAGACSKEETPTRVNTGNQINDYVLNLNYNADELLNVQDTGTGDRKQSQVGTSKVTNEWVAGVGEKKCVRTTYNLQKNFDKLAILRPTQGIVWPGALVKGNQSLTDGLPEPVTLPRAPVTISIDLPGIGKNGVKTVENPTNSSIQVAIDQALEWWNANAYQDGYVNAASSAFNWSTSYSSVQTGLDVGLNMEWASGEVSTAFNGTTDNKKSVVTGVFQQAFYTVTFDTPSSPAAVFAPGLELSALRPEVNSTAPPAYVASVTYGRIIAVRMETTSNATTQDIEGAFKYSAGVVSASGTLESTYKSILRNSTFTVLTLGGNASVATGAITGGADVYKGMLSVIRGDNAIYSRTNPGVAVSYVVRYLSDNSLARLGSQTEYTTTECSLNTMRVTVKYRGIKVIKDCRFFAGKFYWTLGARVPGWSQIARRTKADAIQGSDGDYFTLNLSKTYTIPKTDPATITVAGDVWEEGAGIHFPDMEVPHNLPLNLIYSYRTYSSTLDYGTVGISPCKIRVDYAIAVEQ